MKVIADTSVWSLVLRHSNQKQSGIVKHFTQLILDHRIVMLGLVRQELLSGIRHQMQFEKLQKHLNSFPDIPIQTEDYEKAASFFNQCRAKGVQGSNIDFLICAISARTQYPVYTTDKDFKLFEKHVPVLLYQ